MDATHRLRGLLSPTGRTDWETPPELYAWINARYGPCTLDVCATDANAKCPRWFTPEQDGLAQPWSGTCYMNPPYGRAIARWIEKAHSEAAAGRCTVIGLIPARTDTRWWHEHVWGIAAVHFLRGRVRFVGGGPAPFPSAVAVWYPGCRAEKT